MIESAINNKKCPYCKKDIVVVIHQNKENKIISIVLNRIDEIIKKMK